MTKKQLQKENKILRQGFKDLVFECTEKFESILEENKNLKKYKDELALQSITDLVEAELEIKRLNTIIDYLETKWKEKSKN